MLLAADMSAITPAKRAAAGGAQSKKRFAVDSADSDLSQKIRGTEDRSARHDVSRYVWWDSHEGSSTSGDRTFPTRRMALLYVAKRNSEEFASFIEASGKSWTNFFVSEGPYALSPNAPFELATFADLSDEAIEAYANGVCDAFSRHKVERGVSYRYAP